MLVDQLCLDVEAPSAPDPCYFALRPDARAASEIGEVARQWSGRCSLTGRIYGPDRLHVSLAGVISPRGFRKDDIAAGLRAAATVTAAPFAIAFDRICTFQGRSKRPIVLRCGQGLVEITALREELRRALLRAGLWRGQTQFEPHLTMLWDERRVPEAGLDTPVGWMAKDFVLVKSLYGLGRQVELGRWPLLN
jgi:2'-5' RNA ligase